jgi:phosphomannomutase
MEKIIITEEIMQKESLKEWADSFQLGTAGYRDVLNPDDFYDPTVSFNRLKISIMAEARARVLKREVGESGLCLHVGGEVRPHTREFIDLVSRIYAGHGIRVRRRPKGKTTPIWYSSFGTFYEELTGGENFTASHSQFFKGGWKPMDGEGKQLLEMAGLIAEEVRKIAIVGTEILIAPLDSNLILDDFDVTEPYTDYLKTIVKEEHIHAVNEAGKNGFKAFFATLGGSMAGTSSEIFEKIGIPVGDEKVVNFLFPEESPSYHNIGMVDGVNHGVDPGKWQVYKNIGAQNILENRLANVVFLWDPDGDRFNMVTSAPAALSQKASEMGMEVEPLPGDPKNVCVYFKPCQIYFMLTAWLLEQLKESGELETRDWLIMETFPTSRSIAELGEKFGVKVFFTPVGFKHFGHATAEIERALEAGVKEDEDDGITIDDSLGQEHGIGLNPRILAMMEESGGAAIGGAEFIKSRNGRKKALAIREKDGMQIGLISLVLAAELFGKKSCFAAYYLEALEKYEIKNRFYHREDLVLYDEGIKDRSEREKAKAEGLLKRDSIVSFFRNLAEGVRKGEVSITEAARVLNKKQSFMELSSLLNIYWAGDGTFLEFPDFWVGIRASGTDAVMRYYMEGTEKYLLNKVSRAIMSVE